jgi:alpha/beta superfamily hydrolase
MGGDMNNSVVMAICHALTQAGIASLRFNFRGTGGSQGAYDDGRGEIDDALGALRFLASHKGIEAGNVGLAGYSFGAGVAMKAALKDDLPKALSVVARARVDSEDDLERRPSLPMQFVVGDRDRLMPLDQVNDLVARLTVPPEMHVIPGADHFFQGQEREVGELVAGFFLRVLKPAPQI